MFNLPEKKATLLQRQQVEDSQRAGLTPFRCWRSKVSCTSQEVVCMLSVWVGVGDGTEQSASEEGEEEKR